MSEKTSRSNTPRRRFWLLASGALLLAAGAVIAGFALHHSTPLTEMALDGGLEVKIWKQSSKRSLSIDADGVLPIIAGDRIDLTAKYHNNPAHTYLIWFDCNGKRLPLYPWNMDRLENGDLAASPKCAATKIVLSPMTIGQGWEIGPGNGLDTFLLLARRNPLPDGVPLETLVNALAAPPLAAHNEFAVLGLDRPATVIRSIAAGNRGSQQDVTERDRDLVEMMNRLASHFELIRAVRIAHAGN